MTNDSKVETPVANVVLEFHCVCGETQRMLLEDLPVTGPPLCFECDPNGQEMSMGGTMLVDPKEENKVRIRITKE